MGQNQVLHFHSCVLCYPKYRSLVVVKTMPITTLRLRYLRGYLSMDQKFIELISKEHSVLELMENKYGCIKVLPKISKKLTTIWVRTFL